MIERFRWTILLAVCCVIVLHSNSFAQRGRMTVEERLKTLTEQLTLSPAQAESIKVILVAGDSMRTKLFAEYRDDRSAMREAMQKFNAEQDKKIEALLTDEQKAKYLKLLEERQQRSSSRGQDNH